MNSIREPENPSESQPKARRAARGRQRDDSSQPTNPPAFEEALARLEEIVAQLEGGQLPLDQALSLYEEGVRLYHLCETVLDSATLRLERLRIGPAPDDEADDEPSDGPEAMFFVETFDPDER